jgi:hypothetical protein
MYMAAAGPEGRGKNQSKWNTKAWERLATVATTPDLCLAGKKQSEHTLHFMHTAAHTCCRRHEVEYIRYFQRCAQNQTPHNVVCLYILTGQAAAHTRHAVNSTGNLMMMMNSTVRLELAAP